MKYYVERDANGDVVTIRANPIAGMDLESLPENHSDIKKFNDRMVGPKVPNALSMLALGWAINRGVVTDQKTIDEYDTECQALYDQYAKG